MLIIQYSLNKKKPYLGFYIYIIFTSAYFIIGDKMKLRGCNNCCGNNFGGGLFTIFAILTLSVLIFYQTIITLILPFRFNIFILLVEVSILFFLLFRIIWPR